jgi:PLP dependent protein
MVYSSNTKMTLSHSIQHLQQLIHTTEQSCDRTPGSVLLLAVSKQHSVESIEEAFNLGITHFGENYYQEAEQKIQKLAHLNISWHFIGPIQGNKAKGIAMNFDWAHSVSRISSAQRLNQYRSGDLPPLNICLQVNMIEEASKSGVPCDEVMELARAIHELPRLKLRGLMTIPPPQHDLQVQYEIFMQLNQLMYSLNNQLGLHMDTLSMGMSEDLVPAIQAGSTIVRIGRALFGTRIQKG